MKRAKQMRPIFKFRAPIEWMLDMTEPVYSKDSLVYSPPWVLLYNGPTIADLDNSLPDEIEYDCPIHGKCGGYGECPRC